MDLNIWRMTNHPASPEGQNGNAFCNSYGQNGEASVTWLTADTNITDMSRKSVYITLKTGQLAPDVLTNQLKHVHDQPTTR